MAAAPSFDVSKVKRFLNSGSLEKGLSWQGKGHANIGMMFFEETADTKVLLDGMTKAGKNKAGLELSITNMEKMLLYWLGREALGNVYGIINNMGRLVKLTPNKKVTLETRLKNREGPPLKHTEQLKDSIRFHVKDSMLLFSAVGEHRNANGATESNARILSIMENGAQFAMTKKMQAYFRARAATAETRGQSHDPQTPMDRMFARTTSGWDRLANIKEGTIVIIPARPILKPALEAATKKLMANEKMIGQWGQVLREFILTGEAVPTRLMTAGGTDFEEL